MRENATVSPTVRAVMPFDGRRVPFRSNMRMSAFGALFEVEVVMVTSPSWHKLLRASPRKPKEVMSTRWS